jgi:hypothetical protein
LGFTDPFPIELNVVIPVVTPVQPVTVNAAFQGLYKEVYGAPVVGRITEPESAKTVLVKLSPLLLAFPV